MPAVRPTCGPLLMAVLRGPATLEPPAVSGAAGPREAQADTVRPELRGLDEGSRYAISDFGTPRAKEMAGEEPMTVGLPLAAPHRPALLLVRYGRSR